MIVQFDFTLETTGRGFFDITHQVAGYVTQSKASLGLCHLFLVHTSASFVLCENYDPAVKVDLETFFAKLAPDGDHNYTHRDEGPDDMPSHIRTVLTQNSLTIPITQQRLNLGRWQSVYIWEHRLVKHQRKVIVTIQGE